MLTVSNLAMSFGGRTLFEDVSFSIRRGDRVALVGPNGAGKTTLFSLLLGSQTPDSGEIITERGCLVGWLPQETAPVGDETVLALACGQTVPGHASDAVHTDAGSEPKAKRILKNLAFRETDFDRPARELSGGWVMRAHLARLLVMEPDLLLLDEPTNHLDLETLGWFQNHLKNYRGAIFLTSHDRAFLDFLVDGILELKSGSVTKYRGNFGEYLEQRAAREERQWAAYKNQQKEIEALQQFADRFRAKASKASQAQSKLRQIERMEKIEAPESASKTVKIRFPQPARAGQIPLTLEGVDFSYGDHVVYRGLEFECERGDRIALVGPNGAGKSTLLKLLAGVLQPGRGERKTGLRARTAYYAQSRSEMLESDRTIIEEALSIPNPAPEQLTRSVLGAFLFSGDDIYKKIKVLSGGEKSRLALAKILLDPPNVLLMDEPTTHLDMASIDSLVAALEQFEGTLVFISHDVYFIRALAKKVLRISAGKLQWFAGDYDYYLDKSGATSERAALVSGSPLENLRPADAEAAPKENKVSIFKSKEQKRREAMERQERAAKIRALENAVKQEEQAIAKLEARQKEVTLLLEDPSSYEAGGRAMEWNRELTEIAKSLESRTVAWEQAVEKLQQERPAVSSVES